MTPTAKDWAELKRKVLRAKKCSTIERVTGEFDKRFEMGEAIAVYDNPPDPDRPFGEQENGIDYYLPSELKEYAILNIQYARR